MSLNNKQKKLFFILLILVIIAAFVSSKYDYLYKNPIQSFTDSEICKSIGGFYFSNNDESLCLDAKCKIMERYKNAEGDLLYVLKTKVFNPFKLYEKINTKCVNCLPDGAATNDGGACCSGYSRDIPASILEKWVLGEPAKVCAANSPNNPVIKEGGLIDIIGRPIAEALGLNSAVLGFWIAIFVGILLIFLATSMFFR